MILPLAMPGLAAGSVFTFSLTLGDYIIPSIVGAPGFFIGMMVYQQQGTAGNIPLAAAFSVVPIVLIAIYLSLAKRLERSMRCNARGAPVRRNRTPLGPARGLRGPCVPALSGADHPALRVHHRRPHVPVSAAGAHAALVRARVRAQRHVGCHAAVARRRERCARSARWCSARLRRSRLRAARFPGKQTLTVLFALPIALPGIITGIALLSAIKLAGLDPGFWTIVAGHATFCIVIVHNNVVARLRRIPPSWIEASMDLGADGWQTFRLVLLPQVGTALLAGGMLAFALSFDEIIVTIFTVGAREDAADLVLQRAVPAARPARHQRRGGDRHRGDAGADRARVLSDAAARGAQR